MHNLSCANEFYLHENEKWCSYQRLSTYPRFKTKARGELGNGYCIIRPSFNHFYFILLPQSWDSFDQHHESRPLAGAESEVPQNTEFRVPSAIWRNNRYHWLQKWNDYCACALSLLLPALSIDFAASKDRSHHFFYLSFWSCVGNWVRVSSQMWPNTGPVPPPKNIQGWVKVTQG